MHLLRFKFCSIIFFHRLFSSYWKFNWVRTLNCMLKKALCERANNIIILYKIQFNIMRCWWKLILLFSKSLRFCKTVYINGVFFWICNKRKLLAIRNGYALLVFSCMFDCNPDKDCSTLKSGFREYKEFSALPSIIWIVCTCFFMEILKTKKIDASSDFSLFWIRCLRGKNKSQKSHVNYTHLDKNWICMCKVLIIFSQFESWNQL